MFNKFKISVDSFLIIAIVVLASILRFYNFWNLPFMHDEFSAILRTYYNNFSDLIEFGVKQNDSHPAGVQVFIYYWIKVFNLSEASLKFPFILMGTLSVLMIYLVGKQWFSKTSALFAAAVFAIIQFGIFYSQLARPYSPALFFVLLSTYYWTKVVFNKQANSLEIVAYIVAASLASYIHAFSLFFIFMQGISGLFFVKKKLFRNYFFYNLVILVLYLPHLPIFLAQIGRGDIGGWLGKPDLFFLIDFFKYSMNYSWILIALVLVIILIIPFINYNNKTGIFKFRILSFSWFLITYLIAHIYSVYRSPIIQYSTLLFVFPYLLLFGFSFIGELKSKFKIATVVLIMMVGCYSLIVNRQHFKIMYTQGFDGIANEISKEMALSESSNLAVILHSPEHKMFDYYLDKNKLGLDYFKLDNNESISEIVEFLNKKENGILIYGWADYARLEYLEFFKSRYKYILKENQFFNSEYYVFSDSIKSKFSNSYLMSNEDKCKSYKKTINYKSSKPGYSSPIEINIDTLNLTIYDVINIRVGVKYSDADTKDLLVFDLKDKNGDIVLWSSSSLKKFYLNEDSLGYHVFHSKRVMSFYPLLEGNILKAYIWKRDSTLLDVHDIEFYITKVNPIETGLYNEIPKE